jgi:ribose transport system ATP-binding protein
MHRRTAELLSCVGLHSTTSALARELSVGQQQLVEIAKALSFQARILIFDEPTSRLSPIEADRLMSLILELSRRGTAILYVTHRLKEVMRLADRVYVLRDGQLVGTLSGEEITEAKIVSRMVGREILKPGRDEQHRLRNGAPALEVRNLQYRAAVEPISFHIRPGEIVGFAGLVGAGRSELARALFGIDRVTGGDVFVHGTRISIHSPSDATRAGLALVPEDRKTQGLVLPMTIRANVSLPVLRRVSRFGWLNWRREHELAAVMSQKVDLRAANLRQITDQLSGGNQQKVVLAKCLATEPRVLILDEPTCGVDVGAKSQIYSLILSFAARGAAILLISSDMEEVVGLSDRVVVMHEGRITGELQGTDINEEAIAAYAVGIQYPPFGFPRVAK